MSIRRRFTLGRSKLWRLYLLFAVFIGVGLLETKLPVSEIVHRLIEAGLVLGFYGTAIHWVEVNETALRRESMRQHRNVIGRRMMVDSKPIESLVEDDSAQSENVAQPDSIPHVAYRKTGVNGRLHPVVSNDRRRRNRKTLS